MNNYSKEIENELYEEGNNLVSLRRFFHEHPEVSKKEYETAKKIEKELQSYGIETKRVGETGVYGEIKGKGEGKTLILRADIDALPIQEEHDVPYKSKNDGTMHACGHDAHTSSLLIASKILNNNKDKFNGTIKLCFQQAEEIGYGAKVFIKNGLIKGDRSFSLHMASEIPVGKVSATEGPNNASVDFFRIRIKGRACHVSTPEKGIDALFVASQIVVAVQALVTRTTNPTSPVIIGIGVFNAGTSYNVVAQDALLEGTIRVMTKELREKIKRELKELTENISNIFGATSTIEYEDFTSPLINDEKSSNEVQSVIIDLLGEKNLITNRPYSLGGDDFAEFINLVPGCYAYVGSGNKNIKETILSHHDSSFDIDEEALKIATALFVSYSLYYLNDKV